MGDFNMGFRVLIFKGYPAFGGYFFVPTFVSTIVHKESALAGVCWYNEAHTMIIKNHTSGMKEGDLLKTSTFLRVSFEVEEALGISWIEKKVLWRTLHLWMTQVQPPSIHEVVEAVLVSEATVHRHLKVLIKKGWLKMTPSSNDHRIKYLEPTPRLLKVLTRTI
jgi:DNA-binding MarR family transcriptional regulator